MNIYREKDAVHLVLKGEMSFYNVTILKERIFKFIKPEDKVIIVDLSKVNFMDSAGLGLLISLVKRMKSQGGKLIVEYPQLGVQKLIEMTRLDQLMEVRKTSEPTTGSWSEFK